MASLWPSRVGTYCSLSPRLLLLSPRQLQIASMRFRKTMTATNLALCLNPAQHQVKLRLLFLAKTLFLAKSPCSRSNPCPAQNRSALIAAGRFACSSAHAPNRQAPLQSLDCLQQQSSTSLTERFRRLSDSLSVPWSAVCSLRATAVLLCSRPLIRCFLQNNPSSLCPRSLCPQLWLV
jgi:hypothetical protein